MEEEDGKGHEAHAHSGYAAAVYGSILATSLVGAVHYRADAKTVALTLLTTSFVFWIAHVWAGTVASRLETGSGGWARAKQVAAAEWPMVEAGALPFIAVLLAWIGVYSEAVGVDVALVLAIGQLVGWGLLAARRTGASWPRAGVVGAVDGLLGLAIVCLEILLH